MGRRGNFYALVVRLACVATRDGGNIARPCASCATHVEPQSDELIQAPNLLRTAVLQGCSTAHANVCRLPCFYLSTDLVLYSPPDASGQQYPRISVVRTSAFDAHNSRKCNLGL